MLLSSLRSLSQPLAMDGTSVPYLLPAFPCDSVSPTSRVTITPDENNLTILLMNQFFFLLLIIKDRYDGYFVYWVGNHLGSAPVSLKVFPEKGWQAAAHSWNVRKAGRSRGARYGHQHSFLFASCMWTKCEQLPHVSTATSSRRDRLHPLVNCASLVKSFLL